jgi:hypothetical protein
MSKKLFSLSIFTITLVISFVFSAPGVTMASSDNYNAAFPGNSNLLGVDEAHSSVGALPDRDMDIAPGLNFQSYGLQGDWGGQQ